MKYLLFFSAPNLCKGSSNINDMILKNSIFKRFPYCFDIKKFLFLRIGILFFLFSLCKPGFCQDKPQAKSKIGNSAMFRGDITRNTNYDNDTIKSIKNIKWHYKTGSAIRAVPTILNGKIYVG